MISRHGLAFFISFILLTMLGFFLLRKEKYRIWCEKILLRLPVLGRIITYYNVVNITRTLGILLQSEVRVVEAFEIVAESTTHIIYKRHLEKAKRQIIKGEKFSTQFKGNARLFPSMVEQMLSVGEMTGNLSDSLLFCSEMYDEELSDMTKNLTTIIEPALMIIMGIIVGFVAISIITPIYGITQSVSLHG